MQITDHHNEIAPKDTPLFRGQRLKRLRNLANLSRKEVCNDAEKELNANTLKGWELGRYGGLTLKGAQKILDRVAQEGVVCTLDWLLHELGSGPNLLKNYTKTKEINSFSRLNQEQTRWGEEEEQIAQELSLFRSFYQSILEIRVEEDGMLPFYQIGDYLAGVPHFKENIQNLLEAHCIVLTESGEILLRKIRQGANKNRFNLTCINTETSVKEPILYDVQLVAAAPVIWQRRKNKML
jgi:transcriptional regulator with XRE-family HTH domain